MAGLEDKLQKLVSLGITDYEVVSSSLEEGSIRMTRHIRSHEEAVAASPPFGAGELEGYYLWETVESETAGGGHTLTYTYKDAVGYLDAIPCVLESTELKGLGGNKGNGLVSVESVLAICKRDAAAAGVTLEYGGMGGYMAVFSGSSGSVWSTLQEIIRWVPDVQSSCQGNTVKLYRAGMGGTAAGEGGTLALAATASIDLAGIQRGALTVGSCTVDLGQLYDSYASEHDWELYRSSHVANALAFCPEASAAMEGSTLLFTAREAGAAGNGIALGFEVATTHEETRQLQLATPGNDNYNFTWCEIAVTHFPQGRLQRLSIQCRSNANKAFTQEPRWLGVWEATEDGQGWTRLAVSENAVTQAIGQASVWLFDGTASLAGRKLRLTLLDSPEADWQQASVFAARVRPVTEETRGAQLVEDSGYRGDYVPELTLAYAVDVLDDPPPMQAFSGGKDAAAGAAGEVRYTHLISRTVQESMDNLAPPVVAARGRYSFEIPAGESIYQPGAFVYQIPLEDDSSGGNSGGDRVAQQAQAAQDAGTWMLVKGRAVPTGWEMASDGKAVDMCEEAKGDGEWLGFWASFASCRILKRISPGCLAFGTPVFEVVPGAEAYPDDSDSDGDDSGAAPSSGKLQSVYGEDDGVPANYKEDWKGEDKLYVLHSGSFPAGAKARDNVSGLRFCHGTLKQFVWVKSKYSGTASAKEAQAFFSGVMLDKDKKERHYICLKLESVFINRRRKRYQVGTNALGADDPDVETGSGDDGDSDASGDSSLDNGLKMADYYTALYEYYKATRALGQPEVEVSLYGVEGYVPGVTPLSAVFATLGVDYTAARVTWNAADKTLTASNRRKDILGVDDLLQRQTLGKQSAVSSASNARMGSGPEDYGDQPGGGDNPGGGEEEGYPMVSPSISVSLVVEAQAQQLEPFQIYTDDEGEHWINGGVLPGPAGLIRVEPTNIESAWQENREFYVRARWDSGQRKYVAKVLYHSKETD